MSTATKDEKTRAAEKSLEFIESGMQLGLGSGSTAAIMIQLLGQRVRDGLQVQGIPTSVESARLAREAGIPLISFDEVNTLDLTIDGADEADHKLNLIKGGGGALLREKIVASRSERLVIVADSRKRVEQLGMFPLPVEVVQFAWKPIAAALEDLGGHPERRLTPDGEPYVTDEGNFILDCPFGTIASPEELASRLDVMPGVMEHGLFVAMADTLVIAQGNDVVLYQR